MVKKSDKRFSLLFFLLLFILTLIITFTYHQGRGYLNYRAEIYADKAGYYSYLPAAVFCGFDPERFPDSIVEKTGHGFDLNRDHGKVFIKYTYGVSLLVSPFFFATHLLSRAFDVPDEGGFSPWYHRMVNIAAVVYLILGLMLLKRVLARFFKPVVQYTLLLVVYFGTNLFYFTIANSLMSHVYSFFLFALFLYALIRFLDDHKYSWFLLLALAASLAALVRPTNAIIWLLVLFWDVDSGKAIMARIRLILKPKYLVTFLLILLMIWLPQLFYWKHTWGSWLFYTYHDEGFNHWLMPNVHGVWFSPMNGLFLYSPVVLLMIAGMIFMVINRVRNGWLILILFLFVSYLFASWDCWYFGCSYGHRAFIEFYVLFIFSLGFLITRILQARQKILRFGFFLLVFLFSAYNFLFILSWPGCHRGGIWDFTSYQINLTSAGMLPGGYLLKQDYTMPVEVTNTIPFTDPVVLELQRIEYKNPTKIKVATRVKTGDRDNAKELDAFIVCSVERNDSILIYQAAGLDSLAIDRGEWSYIMAGFEIPEWIRDDVVIKIYCWNRGRSDFYLDEMKVSFLVE